MHKLQFKSDYINNNDMVYKLYYSEVEKNNKIAL